MGGRATVGWLVLAAIVAAGCSGDDDDAAVGAPPGPAAEAPPAATSSPLAGTAAADDARAEEAPPESAPPADATATAAPTVATTSRCDPAAATSDGPITLRIWHGLNGNVESYLQILVRRFELAHPGIRLEVEKVSTDYPAAIDRLRETPDDQLPDVIMGSNQTVRLQADSGRFIPITECAGGELPDQFTDLLPAIRRTYTVEGTFWAAPFNVSAPVMLYDQKRWARAGLDPADPPSTFDELEAVIRRLRDSGEAGAGALLYDRSALWLLDQAAARTDRLLVEPANGRAGLDVDRVVFETPEAIEILTTMHELKRDGYVEWIGLNTSGNDDLSRMILPTAPGGLTFNSSAVLGDITRLLGTGEIPDVEVGVAPLPGPGSGSTVGGGAWWIMDGDDPVRNGAAWTFVDWFTQPEIIAEVAAYSGYIPTTARAADHEITQEHWAEWPIFRVAYDQIAAVPDSDAGAGIQVGPMVEVLRNLELAAAYSIDVGNDPATELRRAEELSLEIIQLYADSFESR